MQEHIPVWQCCCLDLMGITYRISDTRSNCMCVALFCLFKYVRPQIPSLTIWRETLHPTSNKIGIQKGPTLLLSTFYHCCSFNEKTQEKRASSLTHSNMALNICSCILEIKIIGCKGFGNLSLSLSLSLTLLCVNVCLWYSIGIQNTND